MSLGAYIVVLITGNVFEVVVWKIEVASEMRLDYKWIFENR